MVVLPITGINPKERRITYGHSLASDVLLLSSGLALGLVILVLVLPGLVSSGLGVVILVFVLRIWSCLHH